MDIKGLLGDGYKEGMSAEEIVSALEMVSIPDAGEISRLKAAISKSNSEAAKYKKELASRMSEEEAEKARQEEERAALSARVKELEEREKISAYTSKYLAKGFSEELAKDTAKAISSGDFDKVLDNHMKYLTDAEKKMKSDLMKATPRGPGGDVGETVMTKDKLKGMSLNEKQKFASEYPDVYREMYKSE